MTENKYEKELVDYAIKLDALIDDQGKISKCAMSVVECQDRSSAVRLLTQIAEINRSERVISEAKKIAVILKDTMLMYFGYIQLTNICRENTEEQDTRTLSELMTGLDELVGLEKVKNKINNLIAYHKVRMLREEQGLFAQKSTLHLAFTGKPGTGKTTVARIVGRIYKQLGLLSKGHFIEVSRTDLIAGYQGQTALKVKKVIERAKGGVMFIDEAYSITENDRSDSYGRECLTELTKALEDYRDDLVVIVAGYTEPMNHFFESNPGLRSRFNTFLQFDDYSAEELNEILERMCIQNDYILNKEARERTSAFLKHCEAEKDENFSNGRLVRNLFDDLVMNHAKRLAKVEEPSREELKLIIESDCIDVLSNDVFSTE